MTMPDLMNCPHSGEGWCLPCVKKLNKRLDDALYILQACNYTLHKFSGNAGNEFSREIKSSDRILKREGM